MKGLSRPFLYERVELGSGAIGGLTLVPGRYNWTSAVMIGSDITLAGGPEDQWIFQLSGTPDMASGVSVQLSGGATSQNIV